MGVRKISITFLIILFSSLGLFAQKIPDFEGDAKAYFNNLANTLSNMGQQDQKELAGRLKKIAGSDLSEEHAAVIKFANDLHYKHNLSFYPATSNLLLGMVSVYEEEKNDKIIFEWAKMLSLYAEYVQVSPSGLQLLGELFKDITVNNAFFRSGKRKWGLENYNVQAILDGNYPVFLFSEATIYGSSFSDTTRIESASGIYSPFEKLILVDPGSRWDYTVIGAENSGAYAEFGYFTINVTGAQFTVDSAYVYYPDFVNESVLGKFTERVNDQRRDYKRPEYPVFVAYNKKFIVPNIAPSIDYYGTYALKGKDILTESVEGSSCNLIIRNASDGIAGRVKADRFIFNFDEQYIKAVGFVNIYQYMDTEPDSISSSITSIEIFFEDQVLIAKPYSRSNKKAQARFMSSYNEMDIITSQLYWDYYGGYTDFGSGEMLGKKPSRIESSSYFQKEIYDKFSNLGSDNFITAIAQRRGLDNRVDLDEVAKEFIYNGKMEDILNLIIPAEQYGFLIYDKETRSAIVMPKAYPYADMGESGSGFDKLAMVSSNNGKDFDVEYDVESGELIANDVPDIILSEKKHVIAYPAVKEVRIGKQKSLEFDGTVLAGKLRIHGRDFALNNEAFTLDLNQIDSMGFYMNPADIDSAGLLVSNPDGINTISVIEGFSGLLQIDDPLNKAGYNEMLDINEFSILSSSKDGYVYYQKHKPYGKAYPKECFGLKIKAPFVDSAFLFNPGKMDLEGTLESVIFPFFSDTARVLDDASIGFETEFTEFTEMYGSVATYKGGLKLNSDGLTGFGAIKFINANLIGSRAHFFCDSTLSQNQLVKMQEVQNGIASFPMGSGSNVRAKLFPNFGDPKMRYETDSAFSLYSGKAKFAGELLHSASELIGDGAIVWRNAKLTSEFIDLQARRFESPDGKLRIYDKDGSSLAFMMSKVESKVDFDSAQARFSTIYDDASILLPTVGYATSHNDFLWKFGQDVITFSKKGGGPGKFTSTNEGFKGFQFEGTEGEYALEQKKLIVTGVKELRIADAVIYPDNETVTINEGGVFSPLNNAKIIIGEQHEFYESTVQIESGNQFKASGFYDFVDANGDKRKIYFNDIKVSALDSLKGFTLASSDLNLDESLPINPHMQFFGQASLTAQANQMQLAGYAKITHEGKFETDWFSYAGILDPADIYFSVDQATDTTGNKIVSGIYEEDGEFKLSFLEIEGKRELLGLVTGKLEVKDNGENIFIATEDYFLNEASVGPLMEFNAKNDESRFIVFASQKLPDLPVDMTRVLQGKIMGRTSDFYMSLYINLPVNDDIMYTLESDFRGIKANGPEVDYSRPENADPNIVIFPPSRDRDRLSKKLFEDYNLNLPREFPFELGVNGMKLESAAEMYQFEGTAALSYAFGKELKVRVQMEYEWDRETKDLELRFKVGGREQISFYIEKKSIEYIPFYPDIAIEFNEIKDLKVSGVKWKAESED